MSLRRATLVMMGAALAAVLGGGAQEAAGKPARRAQAARLQKVPKLPRAAVLYLNGDGAPMRGGADDPADNRASALGAKDERVAVPPFAGSAEEWDDVVACVRRGYAPFAVDVVTKRPAERGYSMVVVGGAPAMLPKIRALSAEAAEHIGGYAPVGNGYERELVAFVFSDELDGNLGKVCQGILHESGHMFGLDHVYACEDPMSYLQCGEQRFLETEQLCGESEPRACRAPLQASGKAATQSSARLLAAHVGWRDGKPPVPTLTAPPEHLALPLLASLDQVIPLDEDDATQGKASGDPTAGANETPSAPTSDGPASTGSSATGSSATTPPGAGRDPSDAENLLDRADRAAAAARKKEARRAATARTARLELRGYPQQASGGFVELVVEAHSDRHIADAALRWSSPAQSISFACGELLTGKDPDASCHHQGNVFTFRIRAGTGLRSVRAIALDGRDVWLVSGDTLITLTQ